MELLTGIKYSICEQHKSSSNSGIERDYADAVKVFDYLIVRNPFNERKELLNIDSGEIVEQNVNVYNSFEIGNKILLNMENKPVFTYSFKRKNIATTMKNRSSIDLDGETLSIDNNLLFQRLSIIAEREHVSLQTSLEYELCSFPASLFDKTGLMRDSCKSNLADAIWKVSSTSNATFPKNKIFVLDGGALIQKRTWQKGETFKDICQKYVDHIIQNFGQSARVVFDGYPTEPTTKDTAHLKRSKGMKGISVQFSLNSKLSMTKEKFLLSKENKQKFNNCLVSYLETYDISAVEADDDADTLVVTTAIDAVKTCDVIVIGEDTDILVLLLHYYNLDLPFKIFFTSDKNTKEKRIWDIREVKTKLPKELVNCILPIHAFLGCDTVSRINSIGKGLESFKKIVANEEYTRNFRKFLEDDANKDDITLCGRTSSVYFIVVEPMINHLTNFVL